MNRHRRLLLRAGPGYLFRDAFTTARAVGAVNGTAAEPGPGDRTVRDLDGVISIAAGWMEWAAQTDGSPGFARQDLVYADRPITRAAGQIIMCKWRCATDNPHYPLALVSSSTPVWESYEDVIHGFYRSGALSLSSVDNEAAGVPLMIFELGVEYWLMIVTQAVGCYYFYAPVVNPNDDLWVSRFSTVGDAETMYVASAGQTAVFSTTNYRVPLSPYTGLLVAEE